MIREYTNEDKELVNALGRTLKEDFDIDNRNELESVLVYILDDLLVGFIEYMKIYETIEIEYIVVNKVYQRKGIGKSLVLEIFKDDKIEKSILEVKKSNIAAINFYKSLGFNSVRIIKNYYGDEDAIAMEMKK